LNGYLLVLPSPGSARHLWTTNCSRCSARKSFSINTYIHVSFSPNKVLANLSIKSL
jgi:hypothetical protein